MQEIATVWQRTTSLHGDVPGDLLHPPLVGVDGHAGDVHPAAPEMYAPGKTAVEYIAYSNATP